jgi:nucleoside-diphosphate-sugar epimerase
VAGGHDVTGLTRSPAKRPLLESFGVRAAVADALDDGALTAAMRAAAPEAVLHLLTAIPPRGAMRLSDLEATNALRTRGTAHLLSAARQAGARRVVAESIVLAYGETGNRTADESFPLATEPPIPGFRPALEAMRSLEEQVLGASARGEIEGVALRYGMFYGPGAGSTEFMVAMLRRRLFPLFGGGRGVLSFIHLEDAASATVAALERGRAGEAYNVVDDAPASLAEFAAAVADAVGAPRPWSLPAWLARPFGDIAVLAARGGATRASNAKATAELGWRPEFPSVREGALTLR